jgi:hypothetical protein
MTEQKRGEKGEERREVTWCDCCGERLAPQSHKTVMTRVCPITTGWHCTLGALGPHWQVTEPGSTGGILACPAEVLRSEVSVCLGMTVQKDTVEGREK